MWVYETEEFRRLVERHGLNENVARQNERIEEAQSRVEVAQRIKPRWPWFLKKEGNFRLIGGIQEIQQREIFVWYRLFVRGEPGYTPFRNLIDDRNTVTQFFDRDHFNTWFENQVQSNREEIQAETLPSDFYPWFHPIHQAIATVTDTSSDVFLESPDWVSRILLEAKDDLRAYYRIVLQIAALRKTDSQLFTICRMDDDARGSDATIVYTRVDANTWYLIAPERKRSTRVYDAVAFIDGKEALRSASRAYPAWVLADDALWLDIQKEADANLALSVEERQILERVAGQGSSAHSLPLFINGQAGSGKSTMLAYLFAGLLKKKIDEDLPGSPLFITYSDRLIDSARKATARLLRSGFDTTTKYQDYDHSDLFATWQEFLLEMLPVEQKTKFLPKSRVSFRDFKASLEGKRGLLRPYNNPVRFSPETIWFVIRSLIKGSDSSEIFDPDDYESEIPEHDRLVSVEDFSSIFANEYQWYQRQLESTDLWDDQDLVKAVLSSDNPESNRFLDITALVVDEAQDFTRCELRLLARKLVYTRYAIPRLNDIRVPIVLAGDPLQTLSPTGFKWQTIRSAFFSELRSMLGDHAHTPEYYPLQNNYRSKPGVVGFANLVQAWRANLFGLDIKAQGAWSPQDSYHFVPRKFTLDDGSRSIVEFTRLLTDTMTVIPVDEGGEIEFVKNDPILSSIYPDASETSRPFTVVSATAVKGLEFGKVVLYKFGDHNLPTIHWGEAQKSRTDLSAEYFFNKLYVGVTRATQDLYVVDTARGTDQLWTHFSSREAERFSSEMGSFLEPLDENGIPGHLLGIEETIEGLEGLEEQNPRENAVKLRNFGIDTRDAKLVRRAEYFFKRTGELEEQRLCSAFALRFEGNHQGAAREFMSIDRPKEAWEDSWESGDWQLMADVLMKSPRVETDEIRTAVLFMSISEPTLEDCRRALDAIERLYLRRGAPGTGDSAWKTFVDRLLSTINTTGLSESESNGIVNGLEILGKQGIREAALKAGDILFEVGRLEDAENSWLRAGPGAAARLARLRAERDGLPQGLVHLIDASLHKDVIDEWLKRGRPKASLWISAVVAAFKASGRPADGFDNLLNASAFVDATDFLLEFDPDMSTHSERFRALIKSIAKEDDAPLLLETIERLRVSIPVVEGGSSRIRPLHLFGVEQLVLAHREAGWLKMPNAWSEAIAILVGPRTGILSWDWSETIRQNDPLVLGAAFELGRFWEKASEVYQDLCDSRDEFKRAESRIRWMYCQAQLQEDLKQRMSSGQRRGVSDTPDKVQKRRLEMAERWRMPGDAQKAAIRQSVPRLSRSTKPISEVRTEGKFEDDEINFSYRLRPEQSAVTITFENRRTLDNFTFNYFTSARQIRFSGEIQQLQDGQLNFFPTSLTPYGVTISHQDQLVLRLVKGSSTIDEYIVLADGDTGADTASISQRRSTPNSRTTLPKQGVKVFELASELGTTVPSLKKAMKILEINSRKDGNSRLSDDEADRVREWYRGRNSSE